MADEPERSRSGKRLFNNCSRPIIAPNGIAGTLSGTSHTYDAMLWGCMMIVFEDHLTIGLTHKRHMHSHTYYVCIYVSAYSITPAPDHNSSYTTFQCIGIGRGE